LLTYLSELSLSNSSNSKQRESISLIQSKHQTNEFIFVLNHKD